MTVLFFRVEEVLNFAGSEAKAPSGRLGVADSLVKELKKKLDEEPVGTQLVLYGDWAKDWNFDDSKCTEDGKYLNKKLERRGLHIADKVEDEEIYQYKERKHVDHAKVLA